MIEFIDVSKQFNRKGVTTDALKNVSLKVEPGEIFGIVGFSGAGKSTLIRMVNRLESPTTGDVKIAGQSLEKSNTKEIRTIKRDIGMIFQHFNLLDSKTVYKNVAMPLILQGVDKGEIDRRVTVLAACGGKDSEKVKVGISGTDTSTWDFIAEKAKEEGIEIEVISFNDYVQPNIALAEGEIDINAFQTVAYFDEFIKERDLDLVPIGTTVLAPMGIYSNKIESLDELEEGDTVALPNDVSNQGRALMLLEQAGILKLVDNYNGLDSIEEAVVENPKNIKLQPLAPAQIPRSLDDVDAAIINNGIARDAGFNIQTDSIFLEDDTATPYVNIIATKQENKDNETYNRIVELYQDEDTSEFIIEHHKGASIPTKLPLSEIGW